MSGIKFTNEEKQWLIENVPKEDFKTWNDVLNAYNKIFLTRTVDQIRDLATKRLHVHRPKASVDFGKFGNGINKRYNHSIGSEKMFDNYIYIKINDIHTGNYNSDFKTNWIQKQRYIWEKEYGKIPEGNIIIFLNGNKKDFSLENLACVPRSVLCTLNKLKWTNKGIITKTGIVWCEHLQAIKNS